MLQRITNDLYSDANSVKAPSWLETEFAISRSYIGGVSRPSDPNISKIPQVVAKNSRLIIKGVSYSILPTWNSRDDKTIGYRS